MAGMGYVDFGKVTSIQVSSEFEGKLNKINMAISEHQLLFGKLPSSTTSLVAYLRDNAKTSEANLEDVKLFNDVVKINSSHPYQTVNNGYTLEICFGTDSNIAQEQVDEDLFNGLLELQKKIRNISGKTDKINIGMACGATIDVLPTDFPAKLWVTYRID